MPTPRPSRFTLRSRPKLRYTSQTTTPPGIPDTYWLRVNATYTAPKTTTIQLGFYVIEVTAELEVETGKTYKISALLINEAIAAGAGALSAGGLRIGCCEKIGPAVALAEAVKLARHIDVPIVIAGLNADYESEAVDRKDLELPPSANKLIGKVIEANPRTVSHYHPIWLSRDDALGKGYATFIHTWFGGQEVGNGVADVLFGRHNPTGRLSVTFPRRLEDTPAFFSYGKGVRDMYYGEGVFVGYRYYEKLQNDPLFAFGYGLSYTAFEYSNLRDPARVELGGQGEQSFEVSVDATNTGDRDGHEIVQVYISDVECGALRPRKELKGFAKVWVAKGETATAEISLDKYALSYWDEEEKK
ncbi:hypothetical protein FALCPG4_018563 [Fusarium falciforme]